MRRKAAIVVALVGLVLAAAIGAAGSPAASDRATATNLTIWVGWSARELNEFKKVVAEYDAKNADVTVKVVGSINDDKITAALRSGNVPDVVSSFTSQNVGVYCPSGGWIDLAPLPEARQDQHEHLPGDDAVLHAVRRQAVRPAAPRGRLRLLLQQGALQEGRPHAAAADARGAHAPTRRSSRRGRPTGRSTSSATTRSSASTRTRSAPTSRSSAAKYFDAAGRSSLSKDPAWQQLLRWQKSLVDYYGHDKLVKWQTGAGDEWSAPHAFGRGKLAMMIDGEWRVAFLAADHKGLSYGTAPMPVGSQEPLRLRLHQRHDHRHPEGRQEPRRRVESRQVPDDEHPRAGDVLERDPQRALDRRRGEVAGAQARPELRDVHEDLRPPALGDDPRDAARLGAPRDLHELPREVAGREGEGPARRPRRGRQADRRQAQAVRRRGALDSGGGRDRGGARRGRGRPPTSQARRRLAPSPDGARLPLALARRLLASSSATRS